MSGGFGPIQGGGSGGGGGAPAGDAVTIFTANASSGVFTPNLSSFHDFHLTLDANGTLANPVSSPTAGQRISLTVQQDATGYRSLSFGTAWKNVSTVIPRQGPLQASRFEFVSNGDGTHSLASFSAIDLKIGISVKDFGAVADGVTDDRPAIQKAIDYAMYQGSGTTGVASIVFVPRGTYVIGDTIHLGYGDTFRSIIFQGENYNFGGDGHFTGPVLNVNFTDRQAINVQGARGTIIRGLSVQSSLYTNWVVNNHLCDYGGTPLLDDTIESNWVPTGYSSTEDRYAPFAGITIDAFSGTQPATHYPNVTFPAFTGVSGQYNKVASSDVKIEDFLIQGFNVGIVSQPCDYDGNGDYLEVHRGHVSFCKWGISIANSQQRNVSLKDIRFVNYTTLTNNVHGRQIGKLSGVIENFDMYAINFVQASTTSYWGPTLFNHIYADGLWRIGKIDGSADGEKSVTFQSCQFAMSQTSARGIPAKFLDDPSGFYADISVVFRDCSFDNYPGVLYFNAKGVQFINCRTEPNRSDVIAYNGCALNATCGGLMLPQARLAERDHSVKTLMYNISTGAPDTIRHVERGYPFGDRDHCIPLLIRSASPSETQNRVDTAYEDVPLARATAFLQGKASAFSSITLSGKTLTMVRSSTLDSYNAECFGLSPGDILWDDQTGTTFFIRSRSGDTIIAEAQNNYRSDGLGGWVLIDSFSTTVGTLYSVNTKTYTLGYPTYGDVAASSPTITNVKRADGYHGDINTYITVGDWLFNYGMSDNNFTNIGKVTARDQTANTITLSGNAQRAESRRRLSYWVRLPPANA